MAWHNTHLRVVDVDAGGRRDDEEPGVVAREGEAVLRDVAFVVDDADDVAVLGLTHDDDAVVVRDREEAAALLRLALRELARAVVHHCPVERLGGVLGTASSRRMRARCERLISRSLQSCGGGTAEERVGESRSPCATHPHTRSHSFDRINSLRAARVASSLDRK